MGKRYLNIDGKKVVTTEITYDDLVKLYKQYIDKFNEVPVFSKCTLKNNMPKGKIINRILAENDITYNDFLLQFGKTLHVRTESKDYDCYINKYKDIVNKLGRCLKANELINNNYGLPSSNWFVKNCPDSNVKTYNDFLDWCGFDKNKTTYDKKYISDKLIEFEKELGRPIKRDDINKNNIGFSMIVIKRLFGGLNNAKQEIGLAKTPKYQPHSFEYYKNILDEILDNIKSTTDRSVISWNDIENPKNNFYGTEHKTLKKAFERENLDIFSYIKSKGFLMNPSAMSYHYTFDDGERVVSSMEFEFSNYLRSLGLQFKKDYFRDVMYKTFSNKTIRTKMNCDYLIIINGIQLFIEIAGVIYNDKYDSWREKEYTSKRHIEYKEKLLKKEEILLDSNKEYLFLFKTELLNGEYKNIFQNKIKTVLENVV